MNKWIAEFDLEDGDTMPEHMDLEYKGAKIDFHCRPMWIPVNERLPKPFTFVNVTCRSLIDDRENWVVETIYLPIPKEANEHGYSDWGNIPMLNWGEAEVIAWVERIIPQPYKSESENI